jgi:oxygen-independent coproporphyrinogen-3 oxidase
MMMQAIGMPSVELVSPPPLSVYVHIPWCIRKCPYCDFNSHEVSGELPEARYIAALVADLESALPQVWGRSVQSVFLGGGTPSLLTEKGLDDLLTALRARLQLAPNAEITMEANPGTFEQARFKAYAAAGVNRLSIGVQSFNSQHLKALGRIHDGVAARRAIEMAAQYFKHFNLDLMYGLPDQNSAQALQDIEIALSYQPHHLSCYQLTLEPHTAFYNHPPTLPDGDAVAQLGELIEARLSEAGYAHYETSAFAQPGYRCVHNLNYWTFGDYLGLGAGAHSKLSAAHRIERQMRYKQPEAYMKAMQAGNAIQEQHEVVAAELPFEFMMNALRLCEGIPVNLFEQRTGLSFAVLTTRLQQAEQRGLMARDFQWLKPTPLGQRFLNDLLQIFLPDVR